MKLLKKIIASTLLLAILTTIAGNYTGNAIDNQPIKAYVLFSNYNIKAIGLLTENMKKVQQENLGKIEYTFYDGKGDQQLQDNQINEVLRKGDANLIILDMVDLNHTKDAINKIKEQNIPLIFAYNGERAAIKSYNRAFLVTVNAVGEGIAQGEILAEAWYKNKEIIDKNRDNVLQYIMLLGSKNNIISMDRSRYIVSTINNRNIENKELAAEFCNWSEDQAKETVNQLFLRFGNKIEAIISVDDGMSIGAVKALRYYGYNLENNEKKIPIVSCEGIPEAIDLIKKGVITGTVVEEPYISSKNFYTIGMNLLNNKNPIEGTNSTIDTSEQVITFPYNEVVTNFE